MSEVYFFQRYHTKENVHSSNALLLLKRVYYYSPKLFYKTLAGWLDVEETQFLPSFTTQERGNKSVPDFCIRQNGFSILVEAKEKNNCFTEDQMRRHLKTLLSETAETKVLIALAPKFTQQDKKVFEGIKDNRVNIIHLTYLQLYFDLKTVCDERKDDELIEMLEEYKDYCNDEQLVDDTDNTIMVRLAGKTLDFNVKNSIYYDQFGSRYEGFRYLGLYKDKSVKFVGKIYKIVKAQLTDDNTPTIECLVPHKAQLSSSEELRVVHALEYQKSLNENVSQPHTYFLIEQFVPVCNFRKNSKMALYGKKKFYLSQFNLPPNCNAEAIAEAMKNKTWEEVEQS